MRTGGLVQTRFLGQPFAEGAQIGRSITTVLAQGTVDHFWVVTAWAKRSGLSRLAAAIQALRERGGKAEAVIGVDEGGATLEGLELAAELFDPVYVFHDPGPRTFHPKLYVAESPSSALALIGSSNLTKGGLFTNYEAALEVSLDKSAETDQELLREIRDYYESLLATGDAVQLLDENLIGHLSEIAVITSEAAQNKGFQRRRSQQRAQSRFGSAVKGLAHAPPPQVEAAPDDEADEDVAARVPAPDEQARGDQPAVVADPPGIRAVWWKRLSASDAQHPPSSDSAVTGVLRLSKAGHPIDWRTYFRRDFFGSEAWATREVSGRPAEEVTVTFRVRVDDAGLGDIPLRIDHAPHREADQNNVPTVLHWAPSQLTSALRDRDFTDYYVVLAKHEDGRFGLEITRTAPPKIDEP